MFAFAVLWRRERHKRQLLLSEESQVESCEDKDDARLPTKVASFVGSCA